MELTLVERSAKASLTGTGARGQNSKCERRQKRELGGPFAGSKNYSCCSLSVFTTSPDTQKSKNGPKGPQNEEG